jgi:hypothetical protein
VSTGPSRLHFYCVHWDGSGWHSGSIGEQYERGLCLIHVLEVLFRVLDWVRYLLLGATPSTGLVSRRPDPGCLQLTTRMTRFDSRV